MAKSLYRSENLELAYLLRQLREESGMIQAKLADKLKRNQTYVSNVELAIRRLDLVELRDYCAGLDIGPVSYTHLDVYKRQAMIGRSSISSQRTQTLG